MHKPATEAAVFVRRLTDLLPSVRGIEVVLAPPFTALQAVRDALGHDSALSLGAQNLFWEDQGAFTGEVSAPMLKDHGCRFVIVGHSERRKFFGEQDEGINKKVRAALRHGLQPILCIGESLAEREESQTDAVVTGQLVKGLSGLSHDDLRTVTIAYEPVWAIGTGRAATLDQAVAVHRLIRQTISDHWKPENGQAVRILYGGSVTPQNIASLLTSNEIDGALVGGACLDPNSFATIAQLAESSSRSK